jgi:hypothetical protein
MKLLIVQCTHCTSVIVPRNKHSRQRPPLRHPSSVFPHARDQVPHPYKSAGGIRVLTDAAETHKQTCFQIVSRVWARMVSLLSEHTHEPYVGVPTVEPNGLSVVPRNVTSSRLRR